MRFFFNVFFIFFPVLIYSQSKLLLIDSIDTRGDVKECIPLSENILIGISTDNRLCKWEVKDHKLIDLSTEFVYSTSVNLFLLSPFKVAMYIPDENKINIYDNNLQYLSSLSLFKIIDVSVKKAFAGALEGFILWTVNDELILLNYQGNKIWTYDLKTFGLNDIDDLEIILINNGFVILIPNKILIFFNSDGIPINIIPTNYQKITYVSKSIVALESEYILKVLTLKDLKEIETIFMYQPVIKLRSNKNLISVLMDDKIYMFRFVN